MFLICAMLENTMPYSLQDYPAQCTAILGHLIAVSGTNKNLPWRGIRLKNMMSYQKTTPKDCRACALIHVWVYIVCMSVLYESSLQYNRLSQSNKLSSRICTVCHGKRKEIGSFTIHVHLSKLYRILQPWSWHWQSTVAFALVIRLKRTVCSDLDGESRSSLMLLVVWQIPHFWHRSASLFKTLCQTKVSTSSSRDGSLLSRGTTSVTAE